jgi:chromosome partitioning protein
MSRIISIINQKGGTGKTTSTINISSYLALRGRQVLVIDMEPQVNATLALGFDPLVLNKSMYDVLLEEDVLLEDVILPTSIRNLYLAPAKVILANTDLNLADKPDKQYYLRHKINGLRKDFDYILIDCPPSLSLLVLNALVASGEVLIPLQADYLSLEGLEQLISSINRVRDNLNPSLKILGVLFCMIDYRLKITRYSADLVKAHFKDLVFNTTIRVCTKLKEAIAFGQSIFEYAPHSRGAKDYKNLAEEIMNGKDYLSLREVNETQH